MTKKGGLRKAKDQARGGVRSAAQTEGAKQRPISVSGVECGEESAALRCHVIPVTAAVCPTCVLRVRLAARTAAAGERLAAAAAAGSGSNERVSVWLAVASCGSAEGQ